MDIEIPEGPTELVPGPAISELGALGIQIQIDKGKINIKQSKVIAKQGEKISQGAADLMSKLDIKPFSIGFEPILAYDTKENKLYLEIKIDQEATVEELKSNYGKSLAFAVEIGYLTKDTISFLLGKASAHGKAIENLAGEEKEEEKVEEVKEEVVEEKAEETKEEVKEEKPTEEPAENQTQSEEKSEEKPEENK